MPSHPALKRAANLHLSIPSKAKDGSPIRAVHGNFEDQSSVKRPLGLPNLAPEQLKSLPISPMDLSRFLIDMVREHR